MEFMAQRLMVWGSNGSSDPLSGVSPCFSVDGFDDADASSNGMHHSMDFYTNYKQSRSKTQRQQEAEQRKTDEHNFTTLLKVHATASRQDIQTAYLTQRDTTVDMTKETAAHYMKSMNEAFAFLSTE